MKTNASRHVRAAGAAIGVLGLSCAAQAQWTTSGSNIYYNTGNVGIATANPSYHLHVVESSSTLNSRAIYGLASSTTGVVNGVYGHTTSDAGRGVIGLASATSGTNFGVYGATSSTAGRGVFGIATAVSGSTYGTFGQCASPDGVAAYGWATSTSGATKGVHGRSDSTGGNGVYGWATAATGFTNGVMGQSDSTAGAGVYGLAPASSGVTYGVYGQAQSPDGTGTYGWATSATGYTVGVQGQSDSTTGAGVFGIAAAGSGPNYGMYGATASTSGNGVRGIALSGTGTAMGVHGVTNNGAAGSFGVFSTGNFGATGTKAFCIDHPADPQNKYLLHYSIESSEVLNSYSGTVKLDAGGQATVQLPAFFASVNKDPRYTLTAVGAPMPLLHVADEIDTAVLAEGAKAEPGRATATCSFRIAGGVPGAKVSWRIEALRNDRWVQVYGAPVELDKQDGDRGTYLQPELYGQPAATGRAFSHPGMTEISASTRPDRM